TCFWPRWRRGCRGSIDRAWLLGRWTLSRLAAGDAAALAPGRVPSLLALEIPTAWWPPAGSNRHSPLDPRDEHCKPALGCAPDTWGTAQARHQCRTDHGCEVHGKETATAVAGLEDLPAQSCRRHRVDGSVPASDHLVSDVVRIIDL